MIAGFCDLVLRCFIDRIVTGVSEFHICLHLQGRRVIWRSQRCQQELLGYEAMSYTRSLRQFLTTFGPPFSMSIFQFCLYILRSLFDKADLHLWENISFYFIKMFLHKRTSRLVGLFGSCSDTTGSLNQCSNEEHCEVKSYREGTFSCATGRPRMTLHLQQALSTICWNTVLLPHRESAVFN
jgi:hypothetical protein